MILPLNTSSIHASAFLVPESFIAEFQPCCLNGIELPSWDQPNELSIGLGPA
jgi:hypothetical protein